MDDKVLDYDPLGLFNGLDRKNLKVKDFCTARQIVFPEQGTPKTASIPPESVYHPHAPRISEYNGDKRAYFKDMKVWSRNSSGVLPFFINTQKNLGDISKWKFSQEPFLGAMKYDGMTKTNFQRKPMPTKEELDKILREIEPRGDSYYKAAQERARTQKKKTAEEKAKKAAAEEQESTSPNDESTIDKIENTLAILKGDTVEGASTVLNPKEFITANAMNALGVSSDQIAILAELMRAKLSTNIEDVSLDQKLRGPSVELIDLNEEDILDTVVSPVAIDNMMESEKQNALKNMVTNLQIEEQMMIQKDIESAKKQGTSDVNENPFSFSAEASKIKIADLKLNAFRDSPMIPLTPSPPLSDPPTARPTSPDPQDALSSVHQLLTNETESRLRDNVGVSKEDVDLDLLILRSGYMNKNLLVKTDSDLRMMLLTTYQNMKEILQKYLVGSTMDSDHLVESLREISMEVSKMSTKLSGILYSSLVRIPAIRKEIRLNLVITHFSPFSFVKILSFDSAVQTSKEINTGLAFSNMAQVSALMQRLMMKLNTTVTTMETAVTQTMVLTGLLHRSVADLSKITQDVIASMNKNKYLKVTGEVYNSAQMVPSKLKGNLTSTSEKPKTIGFDSCTYLVAGFMIIPVSPNGSINWTLYEDIKKTKVKMALDAYDLLQGSSLIVFESLARLKNHDQLKNVIRGLVTAYKGKVFDDAEIFKHINTQNCEMAEQATIYNYSSVKKSLPKH